MDGQPGPAELCERIACLREQVEQARRALNIVIAAYARLDPAHLRVDELGPPASPGALEHDTRAWLARAGVCLAYAREGIGFAHRQASRLALRTAPSKETP